MPAAGAVPRAADKTNETPEELVLRVFRENGENIKHTADALNVKRGTIYHWLRKIGAIPEQGRRERHN